MIRPSLLTLVAMCLVAANPVDPEPLTLRAAITLALANNSDLIVQEQTYRASKARLWLAESYLLPELVGTIRGGRLVVPPSSVGLEATQDTIGGSIGIGGTLPTGLEYRLNLSNGFERLDSVPVIYNRAYRTSIGLEISQPLLRNAFMSVTEAPIRVSCHRLSESEALVRAVAARVLGDVEIAYWQLVLAKEELALRNAAVDLSQEAVRASETQKKFGAASKIDVIEATAALTRAKRDVHQAESDLEAAQGRLASLTQHEDGRAYLPTDEPLTTAPSDTLETMVARALESRPDLQAARANLLAARVELEVADNALWPEVNLVGAVGVSAFSGRLSTEFGTAFFGQASTHGLTGQPIEPIEPDPRFEGGYGKQFENLRYPEASVGVEVKIPLGNAGAEALEQVQRAAVSRSNARVEGLSRRVVYEVRAAYRQLLADLEQVKVALEYVGLAGRLLKGQTTRYKNGVGTSFDVIRANTIVTEAQVGYVRAQIRARISGARLLLAQGTYLERYDIDLVRMKSP